MYYKVKKTSHRLKDEIRNPYNQGSVSGIYIIFLKFNNIKQKPNRKQAKNKNQQFTKEETKCPKNMKRCSTLPEVKKCKF